MLRRLRLLELLLFLPAALFALGGLVLLYLVQTAAQAQIQETFMAEALVAARPAWIYIASLVTIYLVLVITGFSGDQVLLPITATLAALGMVLVRRLAPAVADRQLLWLLLGWGTLLLTVLALQDLTVLRRYRYIWALAGLLLVGATLLLGQDPGGTGARLWLGMGGYYFQPSELLKILLVIYLASYLADNQEILAVGVYRLGPLRLPPLPYLAPLAVMWTLSLLLLVAQRDLGAAMLFFGTYLSMLYVASGRLGYILAGLVLFLAGAWMAIQRFPYVAARLAVWEDPWSQAAGQGYQIVQALIALAAGGVAGVGLGYGHPGYIPAVHTDYILAAIGEEMGLLGTVAVVALYMVLVGRGFRIALHAQDTFHHLLAAGLSAMVGLQTLIIIAGSLKVIPLTGITLPFVSYGGSSLVTNCAAIGILLRVSAAKSSPEADRQRTSPLHHPPGTRPLAVSLLTSFVLVSLALAYWQIAAAPELLARPDNPRPIEEERLVERGRILSADGQELARSLPTAGGYFTRTYSYPPLAATVGYWSLRYGTAGIEASQDQALRGMAGSNLAADLARRFLHRPIIGQDVVLTIDMRLQRVADEALGARHGAVVLLDARTGAILALASHPYFDPNRLEADWQRLKDDPARPLLNRATQGLYTPGSTFKTVTLAAALDTETVSSGQVFSYTLKAPDAKHHGWWHENEYRILCTNHPTKKMPIDLTEAYAWSCNVAFAEIGLKLGPETYKEYASRFGLGSTIPLEIPVTPSRLFHTPDYFTGQERFYALASTAFGQGELAVTPLQMALIAAAMANEGVILQPYLVAEVRDRHGQTVSRASPRIWRIPIPPQTAAQVRAIMAASTEWGWARSAQIKGVKMGGKTGTAETGDAAKPPHSWFVGFAEGPRTTYAVAVIKEFTGYGSEEAAPAAKKVLEAAISIK